MPSLPCWHDGFEHGARLVDGHRRIDALVPLVDVLEIDLQHLVHREVLGEAAVLVAKRAVISRRASVGFGAPRLVGQRHPAALAHDQVGHIYPLSFGSAMGRVYQVISYTIVGRFSVCGKSVVVREWLSAQNMGDWRSGSAGVLHTQGRGFKSLIAHHAASSGRRFSDGPFLLSGAIRRISLSFGGRWRVQDSRFACVRYARRFRLNERCSVQGFSLADGSCRRKTLLTQTGNSLVRIEQPRIKVQGLSAML